MAEVFIGSTVGAEGFSRKVAIKRVLPGYSDNPGFAQMFVAEAQISSQLVHPNIVSVLDFDRDEEARLFLVMELVDGKDLDTLLSTGMLPLPVVIFVIGEMLRGLGFAHDLPIGSGMRGIVHRDVSPHNVLLSWEGAVKVSDFGIAKARAASEATASVFIKGKPAYMSPEQANGQRLDGRSDLFAVGVMLWEMTVGRRLFVAEDTRATLAAVLFGQIPRPRTLRPDLPKDLERVVMKLLERDLPARYATAEDAIADLMNCADAPRGGREALIAVLAERFPADAPVRQSVARARSMGAHPTPVPGTMQGYAPQTVTGHPSVGGASGIGSAVGGFGHGSGQAMSPVSAASSRPGLGTMMSAQTGTLHLPRRRWLSVMLAIGAVAVAAGLAFVAVSAARKPGTSAAHDGANVGSTAGSGSAATLAAGSGSALAAGSGSALAAGSGSALAAGSGSASSGSALVPGDAGVGSAAQVTSDVPHDAPPVDATATAVSVDATAPPTPPTPPVPPTTPSGHATKPGTTPHGDKDKDKHTGDLVIGGFPVTSVTVDGKSYGDSPLRLHLPVGKHKVRLTNTENNIDETFSPMISENKPTILPPDR